MFLKLPNIILKTEVFAPKYFFNTLTCTYIFFCNSEKSRLRFVFAARSDKYFLYNSIVFTPLIARFVTINSCCWRNVINRHVLSYLLATPCTTHSVLYHACKMYLSVFWVFICNQYFGVFRLQVFWDPCRCFF